tara:strand:+ start:325 stop:507 length:183 start_codon:yes stop_codon:yes gene_type:complete
MTSDQLTAIISQIIDENNEMARVLDFTRPEHREYLGGTIAHAMLDREDIHITTTNTSEGN